MSETITCPGCAASFPGSPALHGKKVRCRKCKVEFRVPAPVLVEGAEGLEFLDDEEDCGLEFFEDEPPEPVQLAALADLDPAASYQAPTALLKQTYVIPKGEAIITWRRFWQYNARRLLLLVVFGFGLAIVLYGYGIEVPLAAAFVMAVGAFVCFAAVWAEFEQHSTWAQEVRGSLFLIYTVINLVTGVISAIVGAIN